ncbi:MAG: hypothetical protein ACYC64_04285 [Armatimonadota bacterium]
MKRRLSNISTIFALGLLLSLSAVLFVESPARAMLPTLYYYDVTFASSLSPARRYDVYHSTVCLQGLVNRAAPRLFIKYWPNGNGGGDQEWLNRLGESGGLCEGWSVHTIQAKEELFDLFGSYVKGIVVYDAYASSGVSSTSLVATTAAACEGAIAVRKDTTSGSMYNYLVNTRHYPVLIDLTGKFTGSGTIWQTSTPSTGSAKCDAYIWAQEKYIDTGKCDPTVLSYSLDLYGLKPGVDHYTSLSNLDYAVSRKAFCFELSPWGDEPATDDPTQPLGADLNTYKQVLNACNLKTSGGKMIKVCGFINWDMKYTNATGVGGTHAPVDTEWEMMRLQSAYNAYGEPDAPDPRCFANASFYAGLVPAFRDRRYVQNPPPTYTDMRNRGLISANGSIPSGNYILLAMGDYDAPSWTMYLMLNGIYNDAARGQRYCTWAVNPNLADRMSVGIDYMFRHKTSKDYFVAWDSGAGYIQPQQLYGSRAPSGYGTAVPVWQSHCKEYYRPLDYSISGWLLNGADQLITTDYENYVPFSGDGIGSHLSASATDLVNNVACNAMRGDFYTYDSGDAVMDNASGVNFGWYRTILWSPTDIKNLEDMYATSGHNHKFLDAYTYYYLLRYYLSNKQQSSNYYRATWVGDTIPRIMAAGHTYSVTVTVRNDGWDTWSEASLYRLGHAVVVPGATPAYANYDANGRHVLPSAATVAPGQSATFSFNITAPSTVGNYDLHYDIVRDGVTWFRDQNNLEWKKSLIVAADETDVDTDGDGVPDVIEQANGTLYWHPADSYTLGPSTPGTPTDSGAYTTSSTVTFSWAASTDSHYNVAGYYCQIGITSDGSDVFNGYLGNVPNKTVTGCSVGSTYYCRVQSVNDGGYLSAWSMGSNGIMVVGNAQAAIAQVKSLADGVTVGLSGKVVTAIFGGCFYIEEPGRTMGIRVASFTTPSGLAVGSMVDVAGPLMTNGAGERYISAGIVEKGASL